MQRLDEQANNITVYGLGSYLLDVVYSAGSETYHPYSNTRTVRAHVPVTATAAIPAARHTRVRALRLLHARPARITAEHSNFVLEHYSGLDADGRAGFVIVCYLTLLLVCSCMGDFIQHAVNYSGWLGCDLPFSGETWVACYHSAVGRSSYHTMVVWNISELGSVPDWV